MFFLSGRLRQVFTVVVSEVKDFAILVTRKSQNILKHLLTNVVLNMTLISIIEYNSLGQYWYSLVDITSYPIAQ